MEDRADTSEGGPEAAAHDRITDAVFALDTDWTFTYLNDRAEEAFDLDGRSVVGRSIWLILPELAGSGLQNRCLEAIDRGRPARIEQPIPAAGRRFSMRIYPSETGVTVCAREVPPAERTPEHQRQTLVETVTDVVVTIDEDGTIRRANSATEGVFGYAPSELIGESLGVLIPGATGDHRGALDRYLDGGQPGEWQSVEVTGVRKDGTRIDLSVSFGTHTVDGGERRFTGVIRDVSERNRRERALRAAHDVIVAGDEAFEERIEALLSVCRDAVGTEFATLSRVTDDEYLFDTVISPAGAGVEAGDSVPLETTNCERVVERGETLVLDDIPEQAPSLAERQGNRDLGIECYLGVPVVVDGETTGTFCFYGTQPRSEPFSDWQIAFVEHLASWIGDELERRRYVDRLRALDELNEVVRAVTDEAIAQPTRSEIERRVCEAIAATDSYLFAWIGEADPTNQSVEPRAEAGVEGYTESVSISTDPTEPESAGPTGRALHTGGVQTAHDISTNPSYEPWDEDAEEYGFRSSAAIPVAHEGTIYGVLNVYTDRPEAFTDEVYDVIGLLGKIVGHAIAAIDRKQVLLADSVIDLEFRVSQVLGTYEGAPDTTGEVQFDAVVPRDGGEYVVFGTTSGDGFDLIEWLVEHDEDWEEVLAVRETDEGTAFEVLVVEPRILSAVSAAGGRFVSATVGAGGDLTVRIQLPHDADARSVLGTVRDHYDDTTLVSKQEVTATDSGPRASARIETDDLTDRRLEALRAAYHAGYFEWPRETAGEEVADLLGISAPTFSQHLRAAERSVFGTVFDGE
ncbi:hypothetical protein JCM30237_03630 [Halolamina litorea]|uniref:GAF domain-containing protein n=1 Tax=Halolamina litorea TaxID=1515593 RepID=A0ABD6BSN5_9EURY|nr:GAF domain-containing protein [Halolamina litorea]